MGKFDGVDEAKERRNGRMGWNIEKKENGAVYIASNDSGYYVCLRCHHPTLLLEMDCEYDGIITFSAGIPRYCPWCGVKADTDD